MEVGMEGTTSTWLTTSTKQMANNLNVKEMCACPKKKNQEKGKGVGSQHFYFHITRKMQACK